VIQSRDTPINDSQLDKNIDGTPSKVTKVKYPEIRLIENLGNKPAHPGVLV